MSALPPKADIQRYVRFVPKADIRIAADFLFNHLVGAAASQRKKGEPSCSLRDRPKGLASCRICAPSRREPASRERARRETEERRRTPESRIKGVVVTRSTRDHQARHQSRRRRRWLSQRAGGHRRGCTTLRRHNGGRYAVSRARTQGRVDCCAEVAQGAVRNMIAWPRTDGSQMHRQRN
jgi:hypothetical protein